MAQAVQEMEEVKAEAAAAETAQAEESKEIAYDVDLDSGMEWEVETVPSEEEESDGLSGEVYAGGRGQIPVAKHYNKHLFTWLFSFLLGIYGVDRFCRGQTALGLFKLLTFGGLGVWYVYDWMVAMIKSYSPAYMDMQELLFDEYGRYIY